MNQLNRPTRSLISSLRNKPINLLKSRGSSSPELIIKISSISNNINKQINYYGNFENNQWRNFHSSHVPREAVIASSEFQMNFTKDLFTYCVILSSFLIWIWWWDPKRDGIYYQVLNARDLNDEMWEETLRRGRSKPFVKLNGKVMLKQQKPKNSFNVKPLETNSRTEEEILLIHYFLTCFNHHNPRNNLEPMHYATHDLYLVRNLPLVLQFVDPKDPKKQVTVDFHFRNDLIGLNNSEIIKQNDTLTHLKKERVISGNLLQKFFDRIEGIVLDFNARERNGLIWKREPTVNDKNLEENVLRNGNVSFMGGQFITGPSGKLEFHCSLISHQPEPSFMQHLKDEMRWFERLSINADKWFQSLSKMVE